MAVSLVLQLKLANPILSNSPETAASSSNYAGDITDGRYSIDNNAQENALRPFCVGRRNWLFAHTVAGANASANLYSLLQTCQVNGIDGYRYLRALFIAVPYASMADDVAALLPWRIDLNR